MDLKARQQKIAAALKTIPAKLRALRTAQLKRAQQRRLNHRLSHACRYGTPEAVKSFLEKGANPNVPDLNRDVLLDLALRARKFDIAAALVEGGANPDAGDFIRVPLCHVIGAGQSGLARLMIEKGANINGANDGGDTPLMIAAYRAPDLVDDLLDKGANLEARTRSGATALFSAIRSGDCAGIEKLLARGAKTDVMNDARQTPLAFAMEYRNTEVIGVLQRHLDLNVAPWQKTGEQEVASVSIQRALGYRITEVFNFETQRHTVLSQNLKTGQEAVCVQPLDQIKDKALVEYATRQLKKLEA